jgi:hypothetical protein
VSSSFFTTKKDSRMFLKTPRNSVLAWPLCAVAAALTLTACVAPPERVVVKEQIVVAPAHPAAVRAMPAPIHEDRGQRPGAEWAWLPGHWKWEGRDWAWVHGRWVQQAVPPMPAIIVEQVVVAPSPHHYWVPGHWVWRFDGNGGWYWVKGVWRE